LFTEAVEKVYLLKQIVVGETAINGSGADFLLMAGIESMTRL
jgi:hypothetical protein